MAKKRILCFGDSNTWGYIPGRGGRYPEEVRWTGRLQALLGPDYTVIEEGQSGRTTVWDDPVENRLAGIAYLWPCMESQSPFDLLILMLGTNDTKRYFNVGSLAIAMSAGRLVGEAQRSRFGIGGKPPAVLLVSPIAIRESEIFRDSIDSENVAKAAQFPRFFRQVADQYGCHFFDAAAVAQPSPTDGIHMEPDSHAALAEALAEQVRSILG